VEVKWEYAAPRSSASDLPPGLVEGCLAFAVAVAVAVAADQVDLADTWAAAGNPEAEEDIGLVAVADTGRDYHVE